LRESKDEEDFAKRVAKYAAHQLEASWKTAESLFKYHPDKQLEREIAIDKELNDKWFASDAYKQDIDEFYGEQEDRKWGDPSEFISKEIDRNDDEIVQVSPDYFGRPTANIIRVEGDSVFVHHYQMDEDGKFLNQGRVCLGKIDTDWRDEEAEPIDARFRDIPLERRDDE
jgi:hypothetical protein